MAQSGLVCYSSRSIQSGEVTEWPIVLDSKSSVRRRTVGSNPTLSAIFFSE